jgi:hypothetical protein
VSEAIELYRQLVRYSAAPARGDSVRLRCALRDYLLTQQVNARQVLT